MRIIVHFGMYKTGSSSIQGTLYQNRSKLNICYPDFGRPAHSLILSAAFGEKSIDPNMDSVSFDNHKKRMLSKLKTELDFNSHKNRDVLLSSEALAAFNFKGLKELHSVLTEYANEVIAVGYIRSPKAYMESFFQEKLKGLNVTSFNVKMRFPYYQTSFEKFDRIFGKENVYFWKFDPALFPDGCVVSDFCQRLNIDISHESIVRVNEGLSLESISLLYALSKYRNEVNLGATTFKDSILLVKLLSQLQGKKLRFASEIIAPILDMNRSHIDWMETRMGASLAENITKDDQNAIHSEAELLTFAPETIHWLAEQLGGNYSNCCHSQMTTQDIANWVNMLRLKLASELNSTG